MTQYQAPPIIVTPSSLTLDFLAAHQSITPLYSRLECLHKERPVGLLPLLVTYRRECQGWCQEFSGRGLTLLTVGQKHGFQSTSNAKNLQKIIFHHNGGSMF